MRALGLAEKRIPREQREVINNTAEEAVRAAQRKLVAMPVRGKVHRGTRGRIARGTGWQRGKQTIQVNAPPGMGVLPWGFQSSSGFRHPVFGNMDVWVQQVHNWNWFYGPIYDTFKQADEELHLRLEKIALIIGKMTRSPSG